MSVNKRAIPATCAYKEPNCLLSAGCSSIGINLCSGQSTHDNRLCFHNLNKTMCLDPVPKVIGKRYDRIRRGRTSYLGSFWINKGEVSIIIFVGKRDLAGNL